MDEKDADFRCEIPSPYRRTANYVWYLFIVLSIVFVFLAVFLPRPNECSVDGDCDAYGNYACVSGRCNCTLPEDWHEWQCNPYSPWYAGASVWVWVALSFILTSSIMCCFLLPNRSHELDDLRRRGRALEERVRVLEEGGDVKGRKEKRMSVGNSGYSPLGR
jgi:hypothetical protein